MLSFVFALITIVLITNFIPEPTLARQKEFYSQSFDFKDHKIVILGSSHVGQLNTTMINEAVSQVNPNYAVYNLAYAGDTPQKRVKSISQIVSMKPDIIFYGVSYRDFESTSVSYPLPDPKKAFADATQMINYEYIIAENPKLMTTYAIRKVFEYFGLYEMEKQLIFPNSPFFIYEKTNIDIMNQSQLEENRKLSGASSVYLGQPEENDQFSALKNLIIECQKSNIKFVLFTTPHHRFYFEDLPVSEKQTLDVMIKQLEKEFSIRVYRFDDIYQDLPIWTDINHVAFNRNATIYSQDMSKIILSEIEP